ncbi:MATE family efflux transporter [Barnesiella sp. WM24]|uniref:MATE family efflux transporter n=1 Tax=Barnesiella sp. WM24 TaxID=2558278 RepID=UPI0010718203|nr:MATE family efflux transporter [Barnesiella sp. WM24]TFU94329.1 MATE family efflux transporter [Barnesiella sp. WM24]
MIHFPIAKGLRRQLALLTGPIFIETLLIMTLGAVDTVMLSRHSDASVAAVGVVNQIVMLCFLVFEVINLGTSVLVSQYLGAKLNDRVEKVVGVSLLVNLVIGFTISAMLYFGAVAILRLMGLNDMLLGEGVGYMRIVGAFAFFQALSLTASAALRASNRAIYPMVVVGIVNILNIVGNYMLIFGKFGAPALGVEGAAISTATSRAIAMIILTIILFHTVVKRIPWEIFRRFPKRELSNLLKIGLPSAGEQFSYSSAQIVMTFFINMLGLEVLAARTYVVNIVMFGYLFCIAISQGGAITIGHLVGRGKVRGAFILGKYVMRLAFIITVTLSVAIATAGHWILSLLTDNTEIISIGATLLWLDVLVETGRPINIFATNALRATGDVNYPFYVGLIVMWSLQVAGGYLTGIYFGLGIYALWFMIASDEITRGIIFTRRWWSMKWAGKGFVTT